MKRNMACFCVLIIAMLSLPAFSIHAQTSNPQQTLNQYVADLQKNPNDYALREKIIRHVQTMRQKPAVPDEASKYMDRGIAAFEGAKGEEDFKAASAEFSKAVNLAPWLGDAYRNLAIAQDKSGQYDAALTNLRLYLLTSPSPADEAWAKSLINKVEYRKEKAAKEPSRQAAAAPKQDAFEDLLKKIDGRRYTSWDKGHQILLDVKGRTFVVGFIDNRSYQELYRSEIKGRAFTEPVYSTIPRDIARIVERNWNISENGESITLRFRWSGGETEQLIYRWQR